MAVKSHYQLMWCKWSTDLKSLRVWVIIISETVHNLKAINDSIQGNIIQEKF